MGEINRDKIIALLKSENPRGRPDDIAIYTDAFLAYREASANITKHGSIVIHPRTGAPIENPYLKVQLQATNAIRNIKLKTGDLWD